MFILSHIDMCDDLQCINVSINFVKNPDYILHWSDTDLL